MKSRLAELLAEVKSSLAKHSGILGQLGISSAKEVTKDQVAAMAKLEAAFEQFLLGTKAISVPLISDIETVLDDYFARRPPFSAKKKSEFPDAISIASIRHWCQKNNCTVYIVSEDADLQACCSESGPLFHANSIAEIITAATVSKDVHEALERALQSSEYLKDALIEKVKEMEVFFDRYSAFRGRYISLSSDVDDVTAIRITSVNVFDQKEQQFTCELEIEADLELNIDVEVEAQHSFEKFGEFEPAQHHSIRQNRTEYFYAEVVVSFETSSEDLEFESIYMGMQTISVTSDDLDGYL